MTLTQVDPPPALDDFELTNNLEQLYQLAKDKKSQYQASWRRNYLLLTSRQNQSSGSQPWASNVTDSEIFPILSSRIAWITDQKLNFDVAPAATPGSPWADHMTHLGTHLEQLLDTNWQIQGWDKEVLLAIWDSGLFGAGILKAIWDSGLDSGQGNAAIKRVDAWKFYPDPNATSIDDMNYCFEIKRMSYAEIERRFPSTSRSLIEEAVMQGDATDTGMERPAYNPSGQYPMANPGNLPGSNATVFGLPGQSRRTTGDFLLQNGVNVKECWIRENQRETRPTTDISHGTEEEVVYDQWRVVVYTGHTILLDELAVNLWDHDRHPYERFVDEELGEFWPTPIVSHLAPCQIAIDRLLSSVQGNAELIGNPIFKDVAGSGAERTQIMNRPGQRVTINANAANAGGGGPGWMTPPELPQFVMNTIQFWISRMENISGLSGPQKGQPTSGRAAQQTVQATQEAGFVRIRSALRNLERTLGKTGELVANLIVQNYDAPRVVSIVGDDGVDTAIRLAAQHFYMPKKVDGKVIAEPLKFSLIVKAGSSAPTSRQARIAEADALFAMHAIDAQAVLQAHAWPNWQQVVQRMQAQAQAQAAAQAQQKGGGGQAQPRGPGTGHPH